MRHELQHEEKAEIMIGKKTQENVFQISAELP